MTVTATSRPLSAPGRGRLPAATRDRRPALAALALLLVLGGALASALIAYRSGDRVDVLVARSDVEVGQVLSAGDFTVARVAADGAATIRAEAAQNFVGTSATARIPAGTLLNRTMFLSGTGVVPTGALVVGVVLGPSQRPSTELRAGDVVRVFQVPRDAGTLVPSTVLASAVRVASVQSSVNGDTVRASLLIPENQNTTSLVSAAAANSIALVGLAPDTQPAVDFRTG